MRTAISREEARDMEQAHSEGYHDEFKREGCPLCSRRELSSYPTEAEIKARATDNQQGKLRHSTIIGRERALIEGLAKALNMVIGAPPASKKTQAQLSRHNVGRMWETKLGNAFEVQIVGPEGDITGHIVRVTIELDRFERDDKKED